MMDEPLSDISRSNVSRMTRPHESSFRTQLSGNWFVLRSEDYSYFGFPFGPSTDVPAPGDYDGDGKIDAAVFRPSNSTWYANRSTSGILIQQFGTTGDAPIPNAYVR